MNKKIYFNELMVKSVRCEEIYDKKAKDYREKHIIAITNTVAAKTKYFTYTTQVIKYIDRDNLTKDALWCLVSDYNCYNCCRDEYDFISEFGYEYKEGKRIYNNLAKQSKRLKEIVNSDDTMEELIAYFENY